MPCALRTPRRRKPGSKVIGEVAAGRPFERAVGPGEAVRIFTGGVIPDGADAVVIQENTVADETGTTLTEAAVKAAHPANRRRLQSKVTYCFRRQPPHRSRPFAGGKHETIRSLPYAAGPRSPCSRPVTSWPCRATTPVRTDRCRLQRLRPARAGACRRRRDGRSRDCRRHHRVHHVRHSPGARLRRRHPGDDRRRLRRRPRPGQAIAGGRGRRDGVLADRDAAGQADDARRISEPCG